MALGRVWTLALAPLVDTARAMNLLSALSTAVAGGLTASLVARETRGTARAAWGALAGGLCAGLMATAWSTATETEVYAVALLHAVLTLWCAARAGDGAASEERWLMCSAYLIALAPAVHLSALVAAPAAIALAARRRSGEWRAAGALLLGGALVASAGVGRMSVPLVLAGAAIAVLSLARRREEPWSRAAISVGAVLSLVALAASALLILLVRARHDPLLNQGNPATIASFTDVVARRQYDIASLYPRQAPV